MGFSLINYIGQVVTKAQNIRAIQLCLCNYDSIILLLLCLLSEMEF